MYWFLYDGNVGLQYAIKNAKKRLLKLLLNIDSTKTFDFASEEANRTFRLKVEKNIFGKTKIKRPFFMISFL